MIVEKQKTILLVEDDAILAMTNARTTQTFGYEVITVSTGEEAVIVVEKKPDINLILMDIDLGDSIDGTEAAAIILKDHDIPVVFLSSHTEPEVVRKTEKITSYGYIVKNSCNAVVDASIKMAFKLFDEKQKAKAIEEDLRVHQIELKVQNEEFLDKMTELEVSRAKLFELYELAPVGFFTINQKGMIIEANLTAARLLGVTRKTLIQKFLSLYIQKEDQDLYYLFRSKLLANSADSVQSGKPQSCELRMLLPDRTTFPVFLQATAAQDKEGMPVCRIVLVGLNKD